MRYFTIDKKQAMEVYGNNPGIPDSGLRIYEDGTAYDPADTAAPWEESFFDPEILGEFERQSAEFAAEIIE